MHKNLEQTRADEIQMGEIVDYIFEKYEGDIQFIRKQIKAGNYAGIKSGLVSILMEVFYEEFVKEYEQYSESIDIEINSFKGILQAFILGNIKNIWDFIVDEDIYYFFKYCYFLRQIIFYCINIGYPGGISYLEFVEDILKEHEISSSEDQRKKLADSFKMYLSKVYTTKEEYIRGILAERMTHVSISDKNRGINNDKWEFGPIVLYERIAYEFEFFIRKRNRTKGMEGIIEQLDNIASKRIQMVNIPSLPQDFRELQNRYASLVKKTILQMSDEEFKEYREYIRLKRNYIRKYTLENQQSKKLMYIEELKLFYDLLFNQYEDFIYQALPKDQLDIIARALWQVIQLCGSDETEKQDIWNCLIDLSNTFGQLMDKYESEKRYYKPMIDRWYNSEVVQKYKEGWKQIPVFTIKKSEERIEELYVKNLQENDEGLRDYIELCILTSNLIPKEEDLNQLEYAFRIIFDNLKQWKNQMKERKYVTIDLKELEEKLGYRDERENQYPYRNFRTYFQECVKTRYIRLYKIIYKEITEKNTINPTCIIERYLDSILFKYTDKDMERKIPQRYTGELNQFLLSQLIKYLYPNRMSDPIVDDIYIKKQGILDIADKYQFTQALGFPKEI